MLTFHKSMTLVAATMLAQAIYAQPVPNGDSAFLKDIAEGGLQEVKLGELAQKNAASDSVKRFGERMITDHSKMNQNVQSFASNRGVSLSSDTGLKAKASYQLLAVKSGTSFDKAYISSMIKDHEEDIAAFEKEASEGQDPATKTLASNALPTLREHLRMAREIASQLGVPQ